MSTNMMAPDPDTVWPTSRSFSPSPSPVAREAQPFHYTPAPHLTKGTFLTAPQLVEYFEDFYASLDRVSYAPDFVFERLVANVVSAFTGAERAQPDRTTNGGGDKRGAFERNGSRLEREVRIGLTEEFPHPDGSVMATVQSSINTLRTEMTELKSKVSSLGQQHQQVSEAEHSRIHDPAPQVTDNQPRAILDHHEKPPTISGAGDEIATSTTLLKEPKVVVPEPREALQHQIQANKTEIDENGQLQPDYDQLKTELEKLKYKTLVADYPVIGAYDGNGEQSVDREYRKLNTNGSYPWARDGIPAGFTSLYLKNSSPMHASIDIQQKQVTVRATKSGLLDRAGCIWLGVKEYDPDFQCGLVVSNGQEMVAKSDQAIVFNRPYNAAPKIVVWLKSFQLNLTTRRNLWAHPTDISAKGFTLCVNGLRNKDESAKVTWVAYTPGKSAVVSGSIEITDIGCNPCRALKVSKTGSIAFDTEDFLVPPRVMMAMNRIDVERRHDLRFELKTDDITIAGMKWNLDYWADTPPGPVGASFIALG